MDKIFKGGLHRLLLGLCLVLRVYQVSSLGSPMSGEYIYDGICNPRLCERHKLSLPWCQGLPNHMGLKGRGRESKIETYEARVG